MIASMMMYARPELDQAHAMYWSEIRQQLALLNIASPITLSQDAEEFTVWRHPELVLSQTCGMPYRLYLKDHVTLVGTPDYGLENCPPGYYRSVFVVHQQDTRTDLTDFKDAVFAFNQANSQSGFAAPYWHTRQQGFWFRQRFESGGHALSALAVQQRKAEIACLDAVSWRLLQQYDPAAQQLRELEWTSATPGLPYISSANANRDSFFSAISSAIANLSQKYKTQLGIKDLVQIEQADYLAIPNPPPSALH